MNTTYNYKNSQNRANKYNRNSKKGSSAAIVCDRRAGYEFSENCLSFFDSLIDILSSVRTLVAIKAFFAFVALVGFIGLIGGMDAGAVPLLSGVGFLAILIGFEFIVLRD